MNKSNRRGQRSWWQNISTSAKVFCMVGVICATMVLIVLYFINMSTPTTAITTMAAVALLVIFVMMIAAICRDVSSEMRNNAVSDTNTELIKTMIIQMEVAIQRLNDYYDDFEEIDLDDDEARLVKFAESGQTGADIEKRKHELDQLPREELIRIWTELSNYDYVADMDAIWLRRHARQQKAHNEQGAYEVITDVKAVERQGGVAEGDTGDNNRGKPLVGEVVQPKNPIIAQIGPGEHTGEINVTLVKNSIHGDTGEAQPEKQSDSPEKQPKQPQEQPKVWPSVEEQAKELGISRSFLQYKLSMAGVPHHSLLSEKDQDEIAAFKQRGLRTANAANL